MPIKNTHPIPCKLELETAYNFTNFLITKLFLTRSRTIPNTQIIKFYKLFLSDNESPVPSSEIVNVLDEACLLERKEISEAQTDLVEFKHSVFTTDFSKKIRHLRRGDSGIDSLRCKICKQVFEHDSEREEHFISDIHILRDKYLQNRKGFPTKLKNIKVESMPMMRLNLNEKKIVDITITNVANESYVVDIHDIFQLVHLRGVKSVYVCPRTLNNGEIFKLTLHVGFQEYGYKIFPIVIKLRTPDSEKNLLIEPKFDVFDEDLEHLMPIEPYKPLNKNSIRFSELKVIKGMKYPSPMNSLDSMNNPGLYKLPPFLKTILDNEFKFVDSMPKTLLPKLEETRALLCDSKLTQVLHNQVALNKHNYVDRFHLLMWIEEYQAIKDMLSYDKIDVELITSRSKKDKLFGIEVAGLSEGRPSVMKGDAVYIRRKYDNVKYEGVVFVVEESTIYVAPDEQFSKSYVDHEKVDIEFAINRNPLRLCHRALDQMKSRKIVHSMFPSLYNEKPRKIRLYPMFNKLIANNEQQKQAVTNIVQNTAYPAPYILFGPPGTGKTATLVEAITQVWKLFDRFRICVCAPSNSAADVITERLLKYIPPIQILRLYGLSRADQEISEKLEKCSNFDRVRKELFIPSINQIKSKRIVILTPVTAGRLVNAGIGGGFFDYIFMDEAGHAVEVEMIIPIIGFLTRHNVTNVVGSLVLAGDPKQLGPVIRSNLAAATGFDMSLLERIMLQTNLYAKNPDYNPKVITKLINNYRSHQEILHISNLCFYDNELLAKGPIELISCACEWQSLPVAGFPLIFHSIKGREDRESNSPSYFNISEIQVVQNYVMELLGSKLKQIEVTQNDIGIITPYRKQVHKIRHHFKTKNWDNIEVASVEEFQGKEKLIIIISTVRSRFELISTDYQFGLGFLRNEKRFNVALTRAIALLIVIGNPDILQCDPNWRKLIDYCISKNSYRGEKPSGDIPPNFNPNERLGLDMPHLTINSDLLK